MLLMRKRMATPVTTPMAEAMLQHYAEGGGNGGQCMQKYAEAPDEAGAAAFYAHLQARHPPPLLLLLFDGRAAERC